MTQIEQDLKYQDEKLLGELSIDNATAIQIGQNGVIDPGMFVGGSTGSVATPTTPTVPAFWSQVHSPPGYTMSIDTAGQDINNAAVVLAWPSNNGSDSTSPENVVAYQIRWKKTSASDYHYEMVPGSGNLSGINMSKLIKGLAQNVSYDFAIQAINSIGNVSGWSSTTTATTANATAPATPTNFKVYKAPRGAALEWTANGETDLLGYQCEYLPQLGAGWANGATVTTITLLTPLAILVPIGTTITVTDGGANSQNFVTVTNIGQPGDLTLTVTSATATFSTLTFANFWVNCGQLIVNNALVTGIPMVLPSNANLVGLNLIFRLRAINNSLQVSAWTSNSTAVPIDGNYFDELLAGNLKVFGVLTTTGGLRTSASGARAIVGPNPNNTAQLGFFIHDGGATDWSDATHANISPVFGAGIVFGARHDGTVFVKGTVYASIVNASVFIGSGSTPTYTAPATGFAIDPTNGFRWFSASVLVAQWSPNGTLTIYSGASIYGATIATSSVVGTAHNAGYQLSGNTLTGYIDWLGASRIVAAQTADNAGTWTDRGGLWVAQPGSTIQVLGVPRIFLSESTSAPGTGVPVYNGVGAVTDAFTIVGATGTKGAMQFIATGSTVVDLIALVPSAGHGSISVGRTLLTDWVFHGKVQQQTIPPANNPHDTGQMPVKIYDGSALGASTGPVTIPAGYRTIVIYASWKSTAGGGDMWVRFNADATANYDWNGSETLNAGAPAGVAGAAATYMRVSYATDSGTVAVITVPDAANAVGALRLLTSTAARSAGNANIYSDNFSGQWRTVATALTSIEVGCVNGVTGQVTMWGYV